MVPRPLARCFLAGALAFVSAGAPSVTARAVEGIKVSSMRGVPQVPARPGVRPDTVWVPDRWVILPGGSLPVHVPGQWERRISESEFYTPPVTVGRPSDGTAQTFPGGFQPPVEQRPGR